jgi:hypothetical protein
VVLISSQAKVIDASEEARVTAFGENADRFFPLLEVGKAWFLNPSICLQSFFDVQNL